MIPTHASYLADVARAAHQTGKDLTLEEVAAVIEAVNSLGAADDPCPTCNDQGAVGNILTAQPCPDCAAPGVSTVEDAQAAVPADVMAALNRMCTPLDSSVLKGATADADRFCMQLIRDYILRRPAPAAGDALDAARWRAYAKLFPEVSASFLATHAVDGGNPLPTIKGAAITGGYVVVTPAGWDADKATKLRGAILRLFPVNPAHTPRPSDELAAQRKGDA